MVSEKLIKELQQIIKTHYGKDISFKETSKIGNGLVNLFSILIKIDSKEKQDEQSKLNN